METPSGAAPTVAAQRDARALGLAYLFGTGGVLVLLTLVLPHGTGSDAFALSVISLAAFVVSGATLARGTAFPLLTYEVLVVLGGVFVAGCAWWGGESARAYPLFYVWCALYAFYFFPVAAAVTVTALCSATFAVALVARDLSPVPWVDWVMVAGTIMVAGTLIARLIAQVRAQTGDLAAATDLANAMAAEGDAPWAREAICAAVRRAGGADAVVMLEPSGEGPPLVRARTGDQSVAARLAAAPAAAEALTAGHQVPFGADGTTLEGFRHITGVAQGVLREGIPVGVLVLGWNRPRRVLPDRTASALALYSTALPALLEREERLSGERERRALEINDGIVQGLTEAKYALDLGRAENAAEAVETTLARARELMDRQLELGHEDPVQPGDLRRSEPAR